MEKPNLESRIKIKKTNWLGSDRWPDSKHFDDINLMSNILDYKISKIKLWYGNHFIFLKFRPRFQP